MKREIKRIKELLKSNPSGMTISGLARKLGLNRNTVARYLDIMLTAGKVEMRQIGSAKLFSLSHRIPLTALMDASSNVIAVVNSELRIVQANRGFSELLNIGKNDIIGMNLRESSFSTQSGSEVESRVMESIEGKHSISEVKIELGNGPLYLTISSLPIILGDGSHGACLIAEDITARIVAEEGLKQSEEKFRTLVHSLQDMVFVLDRNNCFQQIHTQPISPWHISEQAYIGKHLREILPPHVVDEVLEKIQALRISGEEGSFDYSMNIRGKEDWFSGTMYLQNDKERIVAVIRNVTEQKKLEEELRTSEERFKTIFRESHTGIGIFDFEGLYIRANKSLLDLFGVQNEDVLKKFNVFDDPNLLSETKERMRAGEISKFETIYDFDEIRKIDLYRTLKTGQILLDTIVGPLGTDEHGSPKIGYILRVNDITHRKNAIKKLEEMKEFYKTILDKIVNGVVVHDKDDKITYINEAGLKVVGLPIEQVLGTNILTGFPKESLKMARELYLIAKRDIEPQRFDTISITSPTGQHFYQSGWLIPLIRDGRYDGLITTIEDITSLTETRFKEQKQVEFLETVIDSLVHPFYIIDAKDYTISMANRTSRLGHLEEGSTCYAITHLRELPCDGEDHPCPLEEVKKTKKSVVVEHVHSQENGEVKNMEIHASPIFDTNGNVTSIIEYNIDVTERKKIEEELRISENRYRSLFENSPTSLWEEDFSQVKEFFDRLRNDGVADFRDHFENHPEDVEQCVNLVRVLDANKASLELHGVQRKDEILGSLTKSFGRDGLGVFCEELIALAEGRTFYRSDIVQLIVRGKRHVLAFQLVVPPGFEKSLSRVYLSIYDVTNRDDTREALRKDDVADTTD